MTDRCWTTYWHDRPTTMDCYDNPTAFLFKQQISTKVNRPTSTTGWPTWMTTMDRPMLTDQCVLKLCIVENFHIFLAQSNALKLLIENFVMMKYYSSPNSPFIKGGYELCWPTLMFNWVTDMEQSSIQSNNRHRQHTSADLFQMTDRHRLTNQLTDIENRYPKFITYSLW